MQNGRAKPCRLRIDLSLPAPTEARAGHDLVAGSRAGIAVAGRGARPVTRIGSA